MIQKEYNEHVLFLFKMRLYEIHFITQTTMKIKRLDITKYNFKIAAKTQKNSKPK